MAPSRALTVYIDKPLSRHRATAMTSRLRNTFLIVAVTALASAGIVSVAKRRSIRANFQPCSDPRSGAVRPVQTRADTPGPTPPG